MFLMHNNILAWLLIISNVVQKINLVKQSVHWGNMLAFILLQLCSMINIFVHGCLS